MSLDRQQSRHACAALCFATLSWLGSTPAAAQQAPAGPASAAELTPNERAQRDADKVFKWILIHSDKPRKATSARDEKHDEKPAQVVVRAKPALRSAEAAPAVPVVGSAAVAPSTSRATETFTAPLSRPIATAPAAALPTNAAPGVATPAPIETALAPLASIDSSAATRSPPAATAAEAIDEVLTPLLRVDPKFPANLMRTLQKGEVRVRFTVLADGSVAEPAVVRTSDSRLRPAALAAVALWRFAPLRKPQTGVVDLVFDLE